MRTHDKTSKLLILLLALACVSLVGDRIHGQNSEAKLFENTSHDFGDVLKGEIPEHRFQFVNSLSETLSIRSVKSSCGCTEAEATRTILHPGEKAEIICRYKTPSTRFAGEKDASVIVLFDQPRLFEQQLTIKGNIVTSVSFAPQKIDFGEAVEGSFKPVKIRLTSKESLRIKEIKNADDAHVNLTAKEVNSTGAGPVEYELTATLLDAAPKGYFQGTIYFDLEVGGQRNGLPTIETHPLSFSAKINSNLQLSRETLNFGTLQPGEIAKQKVVMKSSKPFRIKMVPKDEGFNVTYKSGYKRIHVIEVQCEAPVKIGELDSTIEFLIEYADTLLPDTNPVANSATLRAVAEISYPDGT